MINTLPSPKQISKSKQVGRGIGSGRGGHTTGKGTKGQKSRSGYTKARPGFEGGQNPLSKRLPHLRGMYAGKNTRKRGFVTSKQKKVVIQLSDLENAVKAGEKVTLDRLLELGLLKAYSHKDVLAKIVFDKDIKKKLEVEGVKTTNSAKEAIEKAGGSVK